MSQIRCTITFTADDGTSRSESQQVRIESPTGLAGENRLAHNLFTELKAAVAEYPEPKHNAIARGWLKFPNRPADFEQYFDIQNSQALWLELSNLIMGVELDLFLSQAFKALEPSQEPALEDSAAVNDLFYIHDRKMALLNHSVYGLIKVQDLVSRLLHESLGGDLVDTSKPDWEEDSLKRKNVLKGPGAKRAAAAISLADFNTISAALDLPRNTPKGEIARTYRNRLIHHIRPSVDYPMFFSAVESRTGEEVRDAAGKVIRRTYAIYPRATAQYRFSDLHGALSEYLDAVVAMLQKLSC